MLTDGSSTENSWSCPTPWGGYTESLLPRSETLDASLNPYGNGISYPNAIPHDQIDLCAAEKIGLDGSLMTARETSEAERFFAALPEPESKGKTDDVGLSVRAGAIKYPSPTGNSIQGWDASTLITGQKQQQDGSVSTLLSTAFDVASSDRIPSVLLRREHKDDHLAPVQSTYRAVALPSDDHDARLWSTDGPLNKISERSSQSTMPMESGQSRGFPAEPMRTIRQTLNPVSAQSVRISNRRVAQPPGAGVQPPRGREVAPCVKNGGKVDSVDADEPVESVSAPPATLVDSALELTDAPPSRPRTRSKRDRPEDTASLPDSAQPLKKTKRKKTAKAKKDDETWQPTKATKAKK